MMGRGVLLGLTGLEIDGGIASVSRCIVRALDSCAIEGRYSRVDRVLLLDEPAALPSPPPRGQQRLAAGRQWQFAMQVWSQIQLRNPDLVLFDQMGIARAMHLPLPGRRPPYAIFCHGLELERARLEPAHRKALLGAWRLLANSEATRARLLAIEPTLKARIRVTPNCIDPRNIERWEAIRMAESPSREPAALIVGRMWSEERGKGHDELIEAWPTVVAGIPGAELWVVGAGDDRPRLEDRARELGQETSVRFLGRVSDGELSCLYRRASLFAMPSRQEGFGLVYAEAMWHGLPCLASTADAGAEVVRSEVTGVLVPYGDVQAIAETVVKVLGSTEYVRLLGAQGRAEAESRFSYERFAADIVAALEIED